MNIATNKLLFILAGVFAFASPAKAQPPFSLLQSQPDLFTYYNPAATDNPGGSGIVSKGVIELQKQGDLPYFSSAFLIRTFRADNKICMCMSGHQISNLFSNISHNPVIGSAVHFNSDIYMNFLGRDSVALGRNYNKITGFTKGYLSTATLVGYYDYNDENTIMDVALVLVDKAKLPAASLGMLGYDFSDNNWQVPFYSIGHPQSYPQQISKNLTIDGNYSSYVSTATQLPYAMAPGSSGSPLLTQPQSETETSMVRGIFSGSPGTQTFDASLIIHPLFFGVYIYSTDRLWFSKIKLLETAIRKNCWYKTDSANISRTGTYMQSAIVDNSSSTNPYNTNASVRSTADLTAASSAVFTESTPTLKTNRLHANICELGGFTLPAIYPGATMPWQIEVAAKQVNLAADFNYTASDNSELELSTVVMGTAVTNTSRRLTDSETDADGNGSNRAGGPFTIYPNPSSSGIFTIASDGSLSADQAPTAAVFAADGKKVYQSRIYPDRKNNIDLHQYARGTYFIMVNNKSGTVLLRGTIVY